VSHLTIKKIKFEKSKLVASAILKNGKITISGPRFDQFRPNLVRRCSWTLLSWPAIKKIQILKIQDGGGIPDGGGRHLEKLPYLGRSLADFNQILYGNAVQPS